jgi:hypothetical protein
MLNVETIKLKMEGEEGFHKLVQKLSLICYLFVDPFIEERISNTLNHIVDNCLVQPFLEQKYHKIQVKTF